LGVNSLNSLNFTPNQHTTLPPTWSDNYQKL